MISIWKEAWGGGGHWHLNFISQSSHEIRYDLTRVVISQLI